MNPDAGLAFNAQKDQVMDLQPVRRYPEPSYPTRRMLLADPGVLQRHLPPAWRRLAGVGGILAFFLNAEALAGEPVVPATGAAATIAPIFRHGEGRGAFGCVAVSPPVFLSEEEAMAVIGEELGRKGVTLSQRAVAWADTPIAPRISLKVIPKGTPKEEEWDKAKKRLVEDVANAKPLEVDALDPAKGISVEFISQDDYSRLGGTNPHRGRLVREEDVGEEESTIGAFSSSVSSYDFADAAAYLVGKASVHHETGRRWLGVFYDPMSSAPLAERAKMPEGLDDKAKQAWWEEDWKRRTAAARVVAAEQLRLQVRDFIAWLEGQGAL